MSNKEPDFSNAWRRINARLGRSADIEETRAAAKPAAFATFGDVRGNVINVGAISRAELAQLLSERTQVKE